MFAKRNQSQNRKARSLRLEGLEVRQMMAADLDLFTRIPAPCKLPPDAPALVAGAEHSAQSTKDLNGDGRVNGRDALFIANYLLVSGSQNGVQADSTNSRSDVNADGTVDRADFLAIADNLRSTSTANSNAVELNGGAGGGEVLGGVIQKCSFPPVSTPVTTSSTLESTALTPTSDEVARINTYRRPFNLEEPVIDGTRPEDIRQVMSPTCTALAALAAAADQGYNFAHSIAYRGNGTYDVTLFDHRQPVVVQVQFDGTWNDYDPAPVGQEFWPLLMQRARLQLLGIDPERVSVGLSETQWNGLNDEAHGRLFNAVDALAMFTGQDVQRISPDVMTFRTALKDGKMMVACTGKSVDADLVALHCYAIIKITKTSDEWMVTLYNPWKHDGRQPVKDDDGFVKLSWDEFKKDFVEFAITGSTTKQRLESMSREDLKVALESVDRETLKMDLEVVDIPTLKVALQVVDRATLKTGLEAIDAATLKHAIDVLSAAKLEAVLQTLDAPTQEHVLNYLTLEDPAKFGEILSALSTSQIKDLVEHLDLGSLQQLVRQMNPEAVAKTLSVIDAPTLKHAVEAIPGDKLEDVLSRLNTGTLGTAMINVDRATLYAILRSLNAPLISSALSHLDIPTRNNVLERLASNDPRKFACTFGELTEARIGELVENLSLDELQRLVSEVDESSLARVLECIDRPTLKHAVELMPTEKLPAVLAQLSTGTLSTALINVDATTLTTCVGCLSGATIRVVFAHLDKPTGRNVLSRLDGNGPKLAAVLPAVGDGELKRFMEGLDRPGLQRVVPYIDSSTLDRISHVVDSATWKNVKRYR